MTQIEKRPLSVLLPLLYRELALGRHGDKEHDANAAEMLVEARTHFTRGGWSKWLKENFEMPHHVVLKYVKDAAEFRQRQEEMKEISRMGWTAYLGGYSVRGSFGFGTSKRDRELYSQIIDAGYKVMATKLHPDHGGTNDDMLRLNRFRESMRARG
jgi:hypothetical protein